MLRHTGVFRRPLRGLFAHDLTLFDSQDAQITSFGRKLPSYRAGMRGVLSPGGISVRLEALSSQKMSQSHNRQFTAFSPGACTAVLSDHDAFKFDPMHRCTFP